MPILTPGEWLTLMGMAAGFVVTVLAVGHKVGRLESKITTLESALEATQRAAEKAAVAVREDLDARTKELNDKVEATGSAVAALSGWMAGKFGASVPK